MVAALRQAYALDEEAVAEEDPYQECFADGAAMQPHAVVERPAWQTEVDEHAQIMAFFVTASALLHQEGEGAQPPLRDPSTLSRRELREAIVNAMQNPIVLPRPRGGRPRTQTDQPTRRIYATG